MSFILPSFTSCLTQLTLAMLGLDLHLFKTFQHAPQVGDAILKGDFLVFAWMGTLKQFPHIYLWYFFFGPLLPVSQSEGGGGGGAKGCMHVIRVEKQENSHSVVNVVSVVLQNKYN